MTAQITRTAWTALAPDFKTGTPKAGDTRIVRWTEDRGTVLVPVEVVDRSELFRLGTVAVTPEALHAAARWNPEMIDLFLRRHHTGRWGCLDDADQDANDNAVRAGGPIVSVYRCEGTGYRVVTEADRAATTVALAAES